MRLFTYFTFFIFFIIQTIFSQQINSDKRLQPYIDVLTKEGRDPIDFVLNTLKDHDLIIFDDALHTAVEPFEFYQELIKTPAFNNDAKYIFLEAVSINKQQYIDAYLESETESVEILYPAFQDGFSGLGWSYKTYFDLLHTIYMLNKSLPLDKRLKVFGVANPTYWSEIKTIKDVELFRKTLISFDFLMYKTILSEMNEFKSGKKGIFLTNTRHAYKNIKNKKNEYYWNTGTYFYQWHPGKTYSIRFHNVNLFFVKSEKVTIKWDRIGNGIWDSAFKAYGNRPIAFTLKDNVFGQEDYIGNHMLDVWPDQTMYDAYDALIFLGPLEMMHKTAKVGFMYTKEFKKELERRYKILFTEEQIKKEIAEYNVKNLKELIDEIFVAEPQKLLPQANSIGLIDLWKNKNN
ncbi:MAG: hypothetical protein JW956_02410 [Calditrichaceae bacterium]|nr:hypothetical protein [Calditrichaceae bacterium]